MLISNAIIYVEEQFKKKCFDYLKYAFFVKRDMNETLIHIKSPRFFDFYI